MIEKKSTVPVGVQTEWCDPRTPAETAQPAQGQPPRSAGNPKLEQLSRRTEVVLSRLEPAPGSVSRLVRQFEAASSSSGRRNFSISANAQPHSYADAGTQTAMHDIHNHSIGPGYASSQVNDITLTLAENARKQMALFDEAGVEKFVWAPIPTVIIEGESMSVGCCGNDAHEPQPGHTRLEHNAPSIDGKTYYMDEAFRNGAPMTGDAFDRITSQGKQHYNTSVDWQVGKAFNELRASDPRIADRIYPAITGINLGDANAVSSMLRLKKEYPDTFHIIGEVTMHKEFVDKQNLDYKPEFGPGAPINDIFKFAGRSGMPVVLHCDSSDAEKCIKNKARGQGEYFDGIEQMIERHPDTKFVHAHMGGIGKFAPPGDNHVDKLRHLLNTYPNYSVDMSWDVVAESYSPNSKLVDPKEKAEDEEERRTRIQQMANLIVEFPDRFIMGSDALISRNANSISAPHKLYANLGQGGDSRGKAGLFDYLPPDSVLPRVLSENFDRLLTTAKADSRGYEQDGMAKDLERIQRRTEENTRTPNTWR
ncbi:hypothetical protein FCJ57_14120 [Burkholderia diffusa]|nr:hypothetical protein [Burkholderia diffusa]